MISIIINLFHIHGYSVYIPMISVQVIFTFNSIISGPFINPEVPFLYHFRMTFLFIIDALQALPNIAVLRYLTIGFFDFI